MKEFTLRVISEDEYLNETDLLRLLQKALDHYSFCTKISLYKPTETFNPITTF